MTIMSQKGFGLGIYHHIKPSTNLPKWKWHSPPEKKKNFRE